jgi:peptide/nickel transport system substrate-binding protein
MAGGNAIVLAQSSDYEHVRFGWPREIVSIDPLGYRRLSRPELNVQLHIFDHLLNRDNEGKIQPYLAERYEAIDDLTWRFFLRRDVTFHDGTPFTAEDVQFSIDDMKTSDRAPGLAQFLEDVESVKIIDSHTVEIRTKVPLPTLPARLTTYTPMVSAKQRKGKDPETYVDKPLGTGPFRFVEWRRGDRIVLERNEQYWRGIPRVQRVTIFFIPDDTTRVAALQAGRIDVAVDVTPSLTTLIKKDQTLEVTASPSVRVQWIYIRSDIPPLNDARIRQALNYAVNKQELIQKVQEGFGLPIGQVVPDFFFGYKPEIAVYSFNPEKVKQLLAEAGIPRGFETTLRTAPGWEETARAVAGYLAKFDIKTKVEVMEAGTQYTEFLERRAAPLDYFSWGNWSLLDVDGTLPFVFACKGQWSYYCNPRIDQMIEEMKTVDEQKRLRLAQEAAQIIHDDAPMLFLFAQYDIHAKNKTTAPKEFVARLDNTVRFDWVR